MFDGHVVDPAGVADPAGVVGEAGVAGSAGVVGELAGVVSWLGSLPPAGDDAERVARIAVLEQVKAAAAAAQLAVVAEFAGSQRQANRVAGVSAEHAGRGVAEQVGLARKVAPATAARQVGLARALAEQLPATFGLLRAGVVSEWVATIVAGESAHLSAADRRLVDRQLALELPGLSPGRAQAQTRRLVVQADPAGAVRRASRARADRRVGVRPAPDTMAVLSALLPCEQGVAAYAALGREADALVAGGDGRSRGQIMADTLVARVTGQAQAAAVPAEIGLVMTDATLLSADETAAELVGYGPVPAGVARDIATQAGGGRAAVWVRRLLTDPITGAVADCDSRRRRFDGTLAKLLRYRDRACRDPYCQAPVRHLDHIRPHADGGATTVVNGRGVCERGNYIRHMPGWRIRLVDARSHVVETVTPTGHRYRSAPPPAPSARPPPGRLRAAN